MGRGQTGINAFIGAAITIGLSFTGVSPLLGGGVAGYLQQQSPKSGAKVGALSGILAAVPIFVVTALMVVFFRGSVRRPPPFPGGMELGIVLLLFVPMLIVWIVVLSTVGGYLGAYIRQDAT